MSRFWNTEKPVYHPTYMLRIFKGTPTDLFNEIQRTVNKNNEPLKAHIFRVGAKKKWLCYETQRLEDDFRITIEIVQLLDLQFLNLHLPQSRFYPLAPRVIPRKGTLKNGYGFKSITNLPAHI